MSSHEFERFDATVAATVAAAAGEKARVERRAQGWSDKNAFKALRGHAAAHRPLCTQRNRSAKVLRAVRSGFVRQSSDPSPTQCEYMRYPSAAAKSVSIHTTASAFKCSDIAR